MPYLFLVGRLIFGAFFIFNGIHHFTNAKTMARYAGAKGVPAPSLAVLGTGVLLFLGGLSVALGSYPLVGLWMIVLFFLGSTPMMHNYWAATDPQQKMTEFFQFTKNVALLGATLMMIGVTMMMTSWPLSAGH